MAEATTEANKQVVNAAVNNAAGKVSNAMEGFGEKVVDTKK